MPTQEHLYTTLFTPGTKKVSVCARRVGTRERLSVIAVCNDEGTAEKIVDALNVLQKKLDKLEAPVQRTLEEVRATLAKVRTERDDAYINQRKLESQLRELNDRLQRVTFEHGNALKRINTLEAQKQPA